MKEGANLLISNKKVSNPPSAYTSGNINTARTTQLNQIHRNSQTPWADKLTEVVAGFGYTIKVEGGNQLNEAGDITREMAMTAAAVFGKIKTIYPYSMDIKITGGNGSGCVARANLILKNHSVKFDSTERGELVNLTNNTIGFSTYHKFRDGEIIIYNTDKQTAISGLTTDAPYYCSIKDASTVSLHKKYQDAISAYKNNQFDLAIQEFENIIESQNDLVKGYL